MAWVRLMTALMLAIHGPGAVVSVFVGINGRGWSAWVEAFCVATLWPVVVLQFLVDSPRAPIMWGTLALFWGAMAWAAWNYKEEDNVAFWLLVAGFLLSLIQAMVFAFVFLVMWSLSR